MGDFEIWAFAFPGTRAQYVIHYDLKRDSLILRDPAKDYKAIKTWEKFSKEMPKNWSYELMRRFVYKWLRTYHAYQKLEKEFRPLEAKLKGE